MYKIIFINPANFFKKVIDKVISIIYNDLPLRETRQMRVENRIGQFVMSR